jgi:hypothetical protein
MRKWTADFPGGVNGEQYDPTNPWGDRISALRGTPGQEEFRSLARWTPPSTSEFPRRSRPTRAKFQAKVRSTQEIPREFWTVDRVCSMPDRE